MGAIPTFRFTLFDNPSGARTIGGGTILDSAEVSGTASAIDEFDWSSFVLALSREGNTNGLVTLQIDLLTGGYAALDNIRITASDEAGDLAIPLPAGAWMFLTGAVFGWRKFVRKQS